MQSQWQPPAPRITTPPQEPISELTVDNKPERYSDISLRYLRTHGAVIEEERFIIRITFPPETTIQDLLPCAPARRRRISFPDGAACIFIEDETLPVGDRRFLLIPQPGKDGRWRAYE